MELPAAKVPFLYVPLRNHFEQSFHVPSRLERYGAGRRMDYGEIDPERLAEALEKNLGRTVNCLDVETDGAAKAASLIAELIWRAPLVPASQTRFLEHRGRED